jgi:hypothetical protein
MNKTVEKIMDLVHGQNGQEAIRFIREKPLQEQEKILLASNVVWHFVRYGLAENALSLIKEQGLQAQKKILCIAFVVSDFARLGLGDAVIELIKSQPEQGQKDILAAVLAEEELRGFGFDEKIEEIKAGWSALREAVCPDRKPSSGAGKRTHSL